MPKLIWKIRHLILKTFSDFDKKLFLEKLETLKYENETVMTEYLYHRFWLSFKAFLGCL